MTFFPTPMEDESLFSVCTRYHILTGNSSRSRTSQWLFGYGTGHRAWAFPVGLTQLESISKGMVKASLETLRSRTLLRAYLPLLPFERKIALLKSCVLSTTLTIARAHAGLSRYTDSTGFLKQCQYCTTEQIARYGFSFWIIGHQLPGIWFCETHKTLLSYFKIGSAKAFTWLLPEHCADRSITPKLEVADGLKMLQVGKVMNWICAHDSIDAGVLSAMLKLRLRAAGFCRSEIKLMTIEIDHLTQLFKAHYQEINAPDIAAVNKLDWFQSIHHEKRHYNPLTWAMAIANGPPISAGSLECEYRDALERLPQRDLFGKSRFGGRRMRAPIQLYNAFATADQKHEVFAMTQLSESEINGWLIRDRALGAFWHASIRAKRHRESVQEIKTFTIENPECMRVDVLRNCPRSYRWLEINKPDVLGRILPQVVPKYAHQLSLNFTQIPTPTVDFHFPLGTMRAAPA